MSISLIWIGCRALISELFKGAFVFACFVQNMLSTLRVYAQFSLQHSLSQALNVVGFAVFHCISRTF